MRINKLRQEELTGLVTLYSHKVFVNCAILCTLTDLNACISWLAASAPVQVPFNHFLTHTIFQKILLHFITVRISCEAICTRMLRPAKICYVGSFLLLTLFQRALLATVSMGILFGPQSRIRVINVIKHSTAYITVDKRVICSTM